MHKYNKPSEVNISFEYPDLHDQIFEELLNETKLVFPSVFSELEKAKIIIGYAHKMFNHDGDNVPSSYDPLTILREAKSGKSFRCVEYSVLAMWLLWAYQIPARRIGLKTADVETREYGAGHIVVEFWSSENKKWVMCDVQAGVIPFTKIGPLTSVELAEVIDSGLEVNFEKIENSRFLSDDMFKSERGYIKWIYEYLYFFDVPIKNTLATAEMNKESQILMLVPRGVRSPVMFQNMFAMNAIYTHSIADFYPINNEV